MCVYVYVYYMCVCVWKGGRERERERDNSYRWTQGLDSGGARQPLQERNLPKGRTGHFNVHYGREGRSCLRNGHLALAKIDDKELITDLALTNDDWSR